MTQKEINHADKIYLNFVQEITVLPSFLEITGRLELKVNA